MVERALRDVVVVGLAVRRERRFQLGARLESGLLHHFADAPIEALHQAVGLRVARRAQPVLDAQRLAAHIEVMLPRGLTRLARKALGELAAVVGVRQAGHGLGYQQVLLPQLERHAGRRAVDWRRAGSGRGRRADLDGAGYRASCAARLPRRGQHRHCWRRMFADGDGQTRTGYVSFMRNSRNGESLFAFVGTNEDGFITTIHMKPRTDLFNLLGDDMQSKLKAFRTDTIRSNPQYGWRFQYKP